MDKPTQAQEREFWEWCGFKEWTDSREHWWVSYPDGGSCAAYPDIDLNNLFKYAVPKLPWTERKVILHHWLKEWDDSQGEDPALALFWALWQVKEQSK